MEVPDGAAPASLSSVALPLSMRRPATQYRDPDKQVVGVTAGLVLNVLSPAGN